MARILLCWRIGRWHRVVAVAATGAAAADALGSEPAALECAVLFDRLLAVFRAGRQIAALPPQPGRQRKLVHADRADEKPLRDVHGAAPAWLAAAPEKSVSSWATNPGSRSRTMNTKR